ncbi:MAG: hypothetical protein HOV81_22035 [Kofleriaceae bacterium]|nr:hypothetical protein [Kofleriaceae bacterium]
MLVSLRRAVVAGAILLSAHAAHAVAPKQGNRLETLTAMKAAKAAKPLRTERRIEWAQRTPPLAWSQFVQRSGAKWEAAWDAATGVPVRIWGEGIAVAGSTRDGAIAERAARQALADHLALLAPGASIGDFELASNHFDGSIRSVGFYQRAGGKRVVGGQVSFLFKADRLFVMGSEALPYVTVATPLAKAAPAELRDRGIAALRAQVGLPAGAASPLGDEVVLPLVADDAVLGYRLARPIEIDGGADGRYLGYIDAATGEVLAARQLNAYATGTVLYHSVDRWPQHGRVDRPAPYAHVMVNGVPQTTSGAGGVTWSPDAEAAVQTSIAGDQVTVVNKASDAALASAVYALQPSGQFAWDASGSEADDAQVNAYIATMIVKDFVRANIDNQMPTIDMQITANVNIDNSCNAFYDGRAINFFKSNDQCQNTALLQDVVFHEFGHHVHSVEIIPGVGDFDGAMSEGAADFLAAMITNDSGMGRGFYKSDQALRELDPEEGEWLWPNDIQEIHHTGMIFGGTFWDLRKALIAELGEAAGKQLTYKLYVGALRRSINIASSLVEVLAEDDDDGNLANGTPHECLIRSVFGKHGLRTASGVINAPGQLDTPALAIGISIDVSGVSGRCPSDVATSAKLDWVPSFTGVPAKGSVDATPAGDNKFFAQLPLAKQETVFYKATVQFADGSSMTLADNLADPYYQLYQGRTVPLYCTSFDTDPFAEGWTSGTDDDSETPWKWGPPTSGPNEPHAAYTGTNILAQGLDGPYNPNQRSWVKTPKINIGQYSDVRVQYRRWLSVEDSHFDQAIVSANDRKAWVNYTNDSGDSSSFHHIDKEWRFHDVPLSGFFRGHEVQVGWEITSDPGLQLGGWQLDDVCVVANPFSICGDGVKSPTEQCDDGAQNGDTADLCRTDCRRAVCGDKIVDSKEECDEGGGTDTCSETCTIIEPPDAGCCSTSGSENALHPGSIALSGLVGMLMLRRRRRK